MKLISPYIYPGVGMTDDIIISKVCSYLKIRRELVFNKTRKGSSVYARQLISYFLKERLKIGWTNQTGIFLKNGFALDHSTIIHSVKRITEISYDKRVKADIEAINELL